MAEGLWRQLGGDEWDVFSAGVTPIGVDARAIKSMAEIGIDIRDQQSQAVSEFIDEPFDLIVTVCANADRQCPRFESAGSKVHWPFDDPYFAVGSEEDVRREFARVREGIAQAIRSYLDGMPQSGAAS